VHRLTEISLKREKKGSRETFEENTGSMSLMGDELLRVPAA